MGSRVRSSLLSIRNTPNKYSEGETRTFYAMFARFFLGNDILLKARAKELEALFSLNFIGQA